jgi:RNA polymerase I-specific transcription initiation factor RRN3
VEIQFELDKLDDDMEEELLLGSLSEAGYSAEEDINSEPSPEDDSTETSSFLAPADSTDLTLLRETITTLDALMTTLFNYLSPIFSSPSPTVEAEHLFDSLLTVFLSRILPTYHSRHVQFLLFSTAQSSPLFLDKFLCLLLERSLSPTLPIQARQTSSAYLASFLARAKSLPPDTVRTVTELLCLFLTRILDSPPPPGTFLPSLDGVYAVFQAVLYIYCFRWRELSFQDEETGEMLWMSQLSVIQRMAWSGFNPLAHISRDVAQEFADRAFELQHIFVHSKLAENARRGAVAGFLKRESRGETRVKTGTGEMVLISSAGENVEQGQEEDIPRDWYPFDPYVLPRSKRFVENCFLEYTPRNQDEDETMSDSSEEDSSDEDV